jgi:hypothetical protein
LYFVTYILVEKFTEMCAESSYRRLIQLLLNNVLLCEVLNGCNKVFTDVRMLKNWNTVVALQLIIRSKIKDTSRCELGSDRPQVDTLRAIPSNDVD